MNDDFFRGRIRRVASVGLAALLVVFSLSACQSNKVPTVPNPFAGNKQAAETPKSDKIDIAELEQFCPNITLRSGTAYFDRYEKGGDGDPNRILYQASITNVTRGCMPENETVKINAALAGRIVPGPKGKPGVVNVPIRIVVVKGDTVIYSQLFKHEVQMGQNATDFVFSDPDIVIQKPDKPDVGIFVGFDPGPYDTP
jgi:hypothetical protein